MKKILYYLALFVAYVIIATVLEMIVYLFVGGPIPLLHGIIVIASLYITYKLSGYIKDWMKIE